MFMEIDQVAVDQHIWESIKAGDEAARKLLREQLVGMNLYMHKLSADSPPYTVISLRELQEERVVEAVTIRLYFSESFRR